MALDTTIGGTASDSYGSLAESDTYFAARQTGNWDGSDEHKEMALRRAATYLDNVFRGKWKGIKVNRDQALAWPRSYAIDSDGYSVGASTIPKELKYAQFEAAALFAAGTNLDAPIDRATKSEQVGPIAISYMDGAALTAQYPAVTRWLSDLVNGSTSVNGSFGNGGLVRS